MPSALPASWPASAPVQTLPAVYVTLPNLGTLAVSSWSLDRELQGSLFPGNVRGMSGLSIGSGSVTIKHGDSTGRYTPWAPSGSTRKVETGGDASWFVSYDGPDAADVMSLGAWQVGAASGALTGAVSEVELLEKSYVGKVLPASISQGPLVNTTFYLPSFDQVVLVDMLARALGFYSTPPTVESSLYNASMCGFAGSYKGYGGAGFISLPSDVEWVTSSGALGAYSATTRIDFEGDLYDGSLDSPTVTTDSYYITADVAAGGVAFMFWNSGATDPGWAAGMAGFVYVNPVTGEFRVSADGSTYTSGTWTPGADSDLPNRVQIEMQRIGATGAWTGYKGRVRSADDDSAWSAWVTHSASSSIDQFQFFYGMINAGSTVSGVQLHTELDEAVWQPRTASLEMLGGTLATPYLDSSLTLWDTLQGLVAAWCGAAWVGADGVLYVKNKESMAGLGATATAFDVGTLAEDVPWSLDPDDTADRLEVTYNPATVITVAEDPSPYWPIAWSSDGVVTIPAKKTVTVLATLDAWANVAPLEFTWRFAEDADSVATGIIGLNTASDGTGSTSQNVSITVTAPTTGTAQIKIKNQTSTDLYTVDANGDPCLYLTPAYVVRQADTATIARGLDADVSVNTVTVDLGKYVQTTADAEEIADFIWSRVSAPMWKASSVHTQLDWTHDIGDVLALVHARTGLAQKAIVSKVSYDGSAGQYDQTLDLVLLPPTWADFDTAWAASTWADFDTAWAASTWDDFDDNPTASR
ncbi:MAG: hypothetical protein QM638_01285 [Nocardioides sp.]|uniref:hypothetical protein n=1 Tax=Nocardioides sp. TaxID=35761 RepID=UPI0039E32773